MGLKVAHVLVEDGLGVTGSKGQQEAGRPPRLPAQAAVGRSGFLSHPAWGERNYTQFLHWGGEEEAKVVTHGRRCASPSAGSHLHGNPRGGSDVLAAAFQG